MEAMINSGAGLALLGLGIGTGLVVIGAAFGIGKLAAAALESTGRQPEAAGPIFNQMLLSAALIEGFTFFAIAAIWFGLGPKVSELITKVAAMGVAH